MREWSLISAVEDSLTPASATWTEGSKRYALIKENAAKELGSLPGTRPFDGCGQEDVKRDLYPALEAYGKMLPGLYKELSWHPVNRPMGKERAASPAGGMVFTRKWPLPFGPEHSYDRRGSVRFCFGWFMKPATFMDTHPYPKSYAEDMLRTEIRNNRLILYTPDWRKKKAAGKWDDHLTFEQSLEYEPETIDFGTEREFYTKRRRSDEELARYDSSAADLLTATKSVELILEEYRRTISGWDLSDVFLNALGMNIRSEAAPARRSTGIRYNRFWLSRG